MIIKRGMTFFQDYQFTDVVSSFMHYGGAKSRRRRLREYSAEQREQLATEFAEKNADLGETWRIFGQLNWRYGQSAHSFMKSGLENVEMFRKDKNVKALSQKYPDDYQFLEALYLSPQINQIRELFASVNGWRWWVTLLLPIILSFYVFKSWTLTAAMIVNGIWASEAFNFAAKYEGAEVCGQSIMTYSWKGMWLALSGIWWGKRFGNFFSWGWPAVIAFFRSVDAVSSLVGSQLMDPTTFSDFNKKNYTTYFNGKLVSHTGHFYGLWAGFSMAWFLKNYKWI